MVVRSLQSSRCLRAMLARRLLPRCMYFSGHFGPKLGLYNNCPWSREGPCGFKTL